MYVCSQTVYSGVIYLIKLFETTPVNPFVHGTFAFYKNNSHVLFLVLSSPSGHLGVIDYFLVYFLLLISLVDLVM